MPGNSCLFDLFSDTGQQPLRLRLRPTGARMAFGLHPATAIHTSRGRSDIATHSAVVPGLVPGTHSTLARGGVCWRLQPRRPQALESRGSHHARSEEHTSELQSLMRISYAVFCLKK